MSGTGFHLRIHGRTTTSLVVLGMAEREHGGLKVTTMRNGSFLVQVLSYGFMENVCIFALCSLQQLMVTVSAAGAGKSIIWYDNILIVRVHGAYAIAQFCNY